MKKISLWFTAILLLATTALCSDVSAAESITVNNGQLLNNRTYIPLRTVSQSLGTAITWDQEMKTVIFKNGNNEIYLPANFKRAVVHVPAIDVPYLLDYIDLDAPAQIINGTIYVPLRFVSQALGGSITWNAQTKQASVSRNNKQVIVNMASAAVQLPAGQPLTPNRLQLLSDKLNTVSGLKSIFAANRAAYRPYFSERMIYSTLSHSTLAANRLFHSPTTAVIYTSPTKAMITQSISVHGADLTGETRTAIDRNVYFEYVNGVWKVDRVTFNERMIPYLGLDEDEN